MKTRPQWMSIEQEGLLKYLDRTKEEHNSYGYDDFVGMLTRGVNKTNLARAFGVSVPTMTKWLDVYSKEGEK